MHIACPNCHATYDVPEAALRRGARKLRCARCRHEWVPDVVAEPEEPAVEIPSLPELAGARMPERLEPELPEPALPDQARLEIEPEWHRREREAPDTGLEVTVALVISVMLLLGMAIATLVWRADVMRVLPSTQRLFALIGLH
jgi:predicted Zn finger-like uncharacterized protein